MQNTSNYILTKFGMHSLKNMEIRKKDNVNNNKDERFIICIHAKTAITFELIDGFISNFKIKNITPCTSSRCKLYNIFLN
jgi:hypothetical protein